MRHNLPVQIGKGRSISLSPELIVNMYIEQSPGNAKSQIVAHGVPGFTLFSNIGTDKLRGLHKTQKDGNLYAIVGQTLYSISSAGTASSLGTIGSSGRVFFSDSSTELMIVAGSQAYTYNATEGLERITDTDFHGASSVTYLDGYFIFSNRQSGQKDQFFISSLLDGETYDALDFATAENYPDTLVRVYAFKSLLFLFGTNSIEIWFNAGLADFPFTPSQGAVIDQGLGAAHSIQRVDESLLWLDDEGIVRRLEGNTPVRISTHVVEYLISLGDWKNAYTYAYTQEGHQFYVLTIPAATMSQTAGTYVYDAATQLWHQRKSYEMDYSRVGFYAYAFEKHIVGDVLTGKLYEYSLDVYQENGDPLISEMHFPQIQNDGNRFIVHEFKLDMEVGHHLTRITTQETSNAILIAVYNDGSYYSTDGTTFTQSDLPNVTPNYRAFASNNNASSPVALVIDSNFDVYKTADGASWTLVASDLTGGIGGSTITVGGSGNISGSLYNWLAYSPSLDRWVVVLDTGFGYSDDDGSTWTFEEWTTNHTSAFQNYWCIAWSPQLGLFSCLGSKNGVAMQAMWSVDGTSWTAGTDNVSGHQTWETIRWVSDYSKFFAVGSDYVSESTDGKVWSLVNSDISYNFNSFDYSPSLGRFALVDGVQYFRYSNDELDTISAAASMTGGGGGRSIACIWSSVFARFYATDSSIYYSADGTTSPWTVVSSPGGLGFHNFGELDLSEEQVTTTFDPKVMLRVSSDTRTTGFTEPTRSMGKQGEYDTRVLWNRLGQHGSFTPIVRISDPVKRAVFTSYVEVEPCER